MTGEKKKAGIVKQIFKWLGLGLLVSLILGALVYDAPWKVIVLLLIILAGCTILPKGTVKWFWLSVAAVVIVLIIWVFLPDENGNWRPFTFEEDLAALKVKYAVPDSENAALLYKKLFETLNITSNQPEFYYKTTPSSISEPWLSKDHPETAEWLKGHQKTIDTLIEISRIEKCRFPITASFIDPEYIKYLPKMRSCVQLLLSAANNDMAEGQTDAGLEKYLCMIQSANHLYQQPAMIGFLWGTDIEAEALTCLNRFMIEGQPSKEQLRLIANSIKDLENNWGLDFRKCIDYDKLLSKNMFSFLYEINQKGKVRFSRNPIAVRAWLQQDFPPPTYGHKKRTKVSIIIGWFWLPPTPQKAAQIFDATYEKYYEMAEPNFDWGKKPPEVKPQLKLNYRFLIESLTSYIVAEDDMHEYLDHLALRRGSRLLVAIKQYQIENGSWPANLDAVKSLAPANAFIDPVCGKQFEYENHGKRFSLYGETVNIWPR